MSTQPDGERAAIRLAQANQRLEQEKKIFERRLERDKKLSQVQTAMSWVLLVMLPVIAAGCGYILLDASSFPESVVLAASGGFFVDVCGLVLASYRTLMPGKSPEDLLVATTADPFAAALEEQPPSTGRSNAAATGRSD